MSKQKIVIAFYGITRSLTYTIRSIRENIFKPLEGLGELTVLAHFYDQDRAVNSRSREDGAIIQHEYDLLKADCLMLEKPGLCLPSMHFDLIKSAPDPFKDNYQSLRNLCHQLNSLSKVTRMAQELDPDFVFFVRPDLLYHDTFEHEAKRFVADRQFNVMTPAWHRWTWVNDRFAFTDKSAYMAYGDRAKLIEKFIQVNGHLHSESLLKFALEEAGLQHSVFELKASRVRVGGVVAQEDFSKGRPK